MPPFNRQAWILAALLPALFIAAVLLRLDGWSLPEWHAIIDQSPPSEIIRGTPQKVRSDDFVLDLPMAFAQRSSHPRFATVNPDIGSGQFMPAPIEVPVRGPLALLRPFTWGFYFGYDAGLAWKWWGLTLGLFYSFFLAGWIVTGGRFGISLGIAACLLFSPFVQFWSLHKAEVLIHWALAFAAAAWLLTAARRHAIWAAGIALGWSLAGMALDQIYPPLAVTLGWLLVFAGAAWAWERRAALAAGGRAWHRAGAGALALALAGGALAAFFLVYRGPIDAIRDTVYPGRRFSAGGSFDLWILAAHDALAPVRDQAHLWLPNLCESASFLFTFPGAILAAVAAGRRRAPGALIWAGALAAYIAILLLYGAVGFPDWLARVTLFGSATPNRIQAGLGLADFLLLAAMLSRRPARSEMRGRGWLAAIGWLVCAAALDLWFRSHWPALSWSRLGLALALQGALGALWWGIGAAEWGLALLAAVSIAYTGWFNPWVRGGSRFLFANPLSSAILRLGREDPGARWATYGGVELATLPRVLGVKSIGGYYGCPDPKIWRLFDPDGADRNAWNQSGYVVLAAGAGGEEPFTSPQPGYIVLTARPDAPSFAQAGVRFFLVDGPGPAALFDADPAFRRRFAYPGKAIYERSGP